MSAYRDNRANADVRLPLSPGVPRITALSIFALSVGLLAYSLVNGEVFAYYPYALTFITVVSLVSLVLTERGHARAGFAVVVMTLQLYLLAEPYFLFGDPDMLLMYVVTGSLGILILFSLSALFLPAWALAVSIIVSNVNLSIAVLLSGQQLLVANLPYIVGALVLGGLLVGYMHRERQALLRTVSKDAQTARESERAVHRMLDEKTVLLREVHHRVKNNLQIITSLASLQANQVTDETARNAFCEFKERVATMASVHAGLYESDSLAEIDAADLLSDVLHRVHSIYDRDSRVRVKTRLQPFRLGIGEAVSLGLIVNELAVNSFRHAFNGVESGTIVMTGTVLKGNRYRMSLADDGVGLPVDFDPHDSCSLGLTLVRELGRQLGSTVALDRSADAGTVWSVEIGSHECSSTCGEAVVGAGVSHGVRRRMSIPESN